MQKEQLIAKFQELYGEGGEIMCLFLPLNHSDMALVNSI